MSTREATGDARRTRRCSPWKLSVSASPPPLAELRYHQSIAIVAQHQGRGDTRTGSPQHAHTLELTSFLHATLMRNYYRFRRPFDFAHTLATASRYEERLARRLHGHDARRILHAAKNISLVARPRLDAFVYITRHQHHARQNVPPPRR